MQSVQFVRNISLLPAEKLKSEIEHLVGNNVIVSMRRGADKHLAVLEGIELQSEGINLKFRGDNISSDVSVRAGMSGNHPHDVHKLRDGSIRIEFYRGDERDKIYNITTQKSENS